MDAMMRAQRRQDEHASVLTALVARVDQALALGLEESAGLALASQVLDWVVDAPAKGI